MDQFRLQIIPEKVTDIVLSQDENFNNLFDTKEDAMLELYHYRHQIEDWESETQETETEFFEENKVLIAQTRTLGKGNSMDERVSFAIYNPEGFQLAITWDEIEETGKDADLSR